MTRNAVTCETPCIQAVAPRVSDHSGVTALRLMAASVDHRQRSPLSCSHLDDPMCSAGEVVLIRGIAAAGSASRHLEPAAVRIKLHPLSDCWLSDSCGPRESLMRWMGVIPGTASASRVHIQEQSRDDSDAMRIKIGKSFPIRKKP